MFCPSTWHVQMYFPRLSSETVTSRSEWCCLVCLWGGCSQLQGLGDSWTHGNRRRRPLETRSSLVDGVQRPGGDNKQGGRRELSSRETDMEAYVCLQSYSIAQVISKFKYKNEMNLPSSVSHSLRALSIISPAPGLDTHTHFFLV